MEKILIIIFDTHTSGDAIETCIKMLQCLKPLVHVLSPVDRHAVARVASNEGIRETDARERALHEAYTSLYHLEDTFSRQSLHVTVTAKEMQLPEELIIEIRKTNPDMLIIMGKIESHVLESLYGSFRKPIVLLPPED